MASSLASMAWISGPLAPGPRPGGGAGLALVVDVDGLAMWLVEVAPAVVLVAIDVSISAAPVCVVACGVLPPLQPASPMASTATAAPALNRFRAAANHPPDSWLGEGAQYCRGPHPGGNRAPSAIIAL